MKYIFWIVLTTLVIFRFFTTRPHFVNGQLLKISGQVFSEPSSSYGNLKFNLTGIKVSTSQNSDVHYGDYVVIEGTYKDGEVKGKVSELKVSNNIFISLRNRLVNFYKDSLGSKNGGLVSGIVIGSRYEVPRYLETKFQSSGLTFLIESSGIKISILASLLTSLLLMKLSRRKTVAFVAIFIWFYVLISGFEVTTVKASILATIAFGSQIFGRVTSTIRNTFLAGLIMLIIFPAWITDIGFLLSFAATISIILFGNKITQLLKFLPEIIRQDLGISIAAQIGITPLALLVFGQANFIFPIIKSVMLLWTIPPIMILGGIGGLLGAKIILLPLLPLLTYFTAIVSL